MAYPFKNLIFEGGGVKGVAYAGALRMLEKRGVLQQIERVGGTSAGAITAVMVSLRYSPDEIKELMLKLNFEQFKDGSLLGDVERLFSKYGWYKGETFLEFIEEQIASKTGSRDSSFGELKSKGFRDLYVVGTNLSTRQYQVFSHEQTADVRVADAVRISMSIPFFFASRRYEGDIYVDGGVLNNYPITLFDDDKYIHDPANRTDDCPNAETLGFHLGKNVIERREIKDLDEFIGGVFETILDVQDDALWNEPANLRRTVCINNLGIQTTDFSITAAQKEALMQKGREATANYLRAYDEGARPAVCDEMKRNRRRSA